VNELQQPFKTGQHGQQQEQQKQPEEMGSTWGNESSESFVNTATFIGDQPSDFFQAEQQSDKQRKGF
jgi:hypothetical protein